MGNVEGHGQAFYPVLTVNVGNRKGPVTTDLRHKLLSMYIAHSCSVCIHFCIHACAYVYTSVLDTKHESVYSI